jgi:GNAT superfamily N-acetyltransferase
MLIICPGATASVFLPEDETREQKSPEYRDYVTGLLKFLAGQIDTLNLSLIQTTITQNGLGNEELFLAGDFSKLCDLEIMEAAVAADLCAATDEKIGWQPFTPETQERFEKVISQSYEGTMDCPGLSGLRTMGEVVEGHRYSGIFEPKGWWLMEYEGEDVGVILLNSTEEVANRLELVYMGLARRARGKRLGRVLLSRAFEAAGWLDKKIIRLAVDRKNVPAIKLYRRFGFVPVAHQLVLAVMNEARRKRLAEAKE